MTSSEPLPDRCGARVTDKLGLEIQLTCEDDSHTLTHEQIERVRLVDPDNGACIQGPPIYTDIRKWLWDDYELAAVGVDDAEFSITDSDVAEHFDAGSATEPEQYVEAKRDGLKWFRPNDSVTVEKVTNGYAELQGYCERYPMDDKRRCYVHHKENTFEEGNTERLKHGMYAQRTNFYNSLGQEDKEFIEAMVDEWMKMSPYDRDNAAVMNDLYRAAIDQLRAWNGIEEFAGDEGLTKEQEVFQDGELHEVVEEHPANMPYSRLSNDVRAKLRELGIYDDPESQKADATESLAQKLSGLGSDNA